MDLSRVTQTFLGRFTPPRRIARAAIIFACAAFALLQWYPSRSPTAPLPQVPISYLLLAVLGFFLIAQAVRVWRFLRFPRKMSAAFVCGLTFQQRRACADRYLGRVNREFLLFALIAMAPFNLLCGLVLHSRSAWELLLLPLCTLAIMWLATGGTAKLVALVKPDAKDRLSRGRSWIGILGHTSPLVLALTAALSAPFSGRQRGIVRRELLYLARCDAVPAALALVGLPLIALLLILLVKSQLYGFNALVLILSAAGFAIATLETLQGSAERLDACPYYPYSAKEIFFARCLLLGAPALVSLALFCVLNIGRPLLATLSALAGLVTSLILVTVVGAQLSLQLQSGSWVGTFAGAMMLLILVGTFTPLLGAVFPIAGIFISYLIMRRDNAIPGK
jgi:hypothetical protein